MCSGDELRAPTKLDLQLHLTDANARQFFWFHLELDVLQLLSNGLC